MVFSSITFLFLFLPLVMLLYALIPRRHRNLFLFIVSLFFYAWGETWFVLVMLGSTLLDYVCGLIIGRGFERMEADGVTDPRRRTRGQRLAIAVSVVGGLTALGIFKYFNFAVDNYNALLRAVGLSSMAWENALRITLPIGISFYTFQTMSYTIDVYRRRVPADRSFIDFACFVTMFPQLIAGPIVRYDDIQHELKDRRISLEDFGSGVVLFVVGLGKKVLIANVVAEQADLIFAIPSGQLAAGVAWLGFLYFWLQIYFDFSGYSDMAIGMGRMFGFHFLINFNYPYISRTATEFWTRWHISLSTWLRDYLFVTLGGYRTARPRAYLNLFLVFVLCGLWHGANWTFIVFGAVYGVLLVFERMIHANRLRFFNGIGGNLYMLAVLAVTIVLFRSDTLGQAARHIGAMLGFGAVPGVHHAGMYVDAQVLTATVAGVIGSTPFVPWLGARYEAWVARRGTPGRQAAWEAVRLALATLCLAAVFLLCSMKLAAGTHNPFIYFRF